MKTANHFIMMFVFVLFSSTGLLAVSGEISVDLLNKS